MTRDRLNGILTRIDRRGYKAYKEIAGKYEMGRFTLYIDHVQGDPFAVPSKIRIRVPGAGFPPSLFENRIRRSALEDYLARRVRLVIGRMGKRRGGSGKSGLITIDAGGQEVLERTAAVVTPDWVEARLQVGLPARGRTILGYQAIDLLCEDIPEIAHEALCWETTPREEARLFVACVENQEHIRRQLKAKGLVAFVADGSVLPRESGVSDAPLGPESAVPFQAPESLRISLEVPNPVPQPGAGTQVTGMGIAEGITLIVGGGYHGKSTLLKALERGVYPHVPKDGREYVVTTGDAVKIRSEDGRRAAGVDIGAFIDNLPHGRDTGSFSTDDASGSTSQATNIVEALEIGAGCLLLDEDTSATNFMVRDGRMQALIHKEHEPITPFLDRVRELYHRFGVSTVLVMGGCGDYFDVADSVIAMREYLPHEVTGEARSIGKRMGTQRRDENKGPMHAIRERIPQAESFDASRGRREVKIDAKGVDRILFGEARIELREVEQLLDLSQTRAVGHAIYLAVTRFMDGRATLREIVERLESFFDERGLDELDPFHRREEHPGNFARPRKYEIAAAINRLRTVRMRQVR